MKSFTDLKVWQKGMELMAAAYELSKKFPRSECYGLTQQLHDSTRSVVSNIAEGFGRFTFPDKANRYTIARGECAESESHILMAITLKYVTAEEASRCLGMAREVGRMLSGLISACRSRS